MLSKLPICVRLFFYLFVVFNATIGYSQETSGPSTTNPIVEITEQDGSPSTYPYKVKFANGSVTDNGDGTTSISIPTSATNVGIGTTGRPVIYTGTSTAGPSSSIFESPSGNIGIGTVSPSALFVINSSANQDLFRVDDSAGLDTTPFIIDQTGNVGIGSQNPSAVLAISSTLNQSLFRVDDNGTGDLSPFLIDANGNVGIGTSNTERDKLLVMGGNVGIGTWVPSTLLDVSGVTVTAGLVSTANVGIGTIGPIAPLQVKPAVSFASGTGGSISTYTSGGVTYKVHQFNSSGTFVAPQPATPLTVLVVAQGGYGGDNSGGGGGAGEYVYNTSYSATSAQSIVLTVGNSSTHEANGANSTFGTITALGGGYGGNGFLSQPLGGPGGSGGGGWGNGGGGAAHAGGASTAVQGLGFAGGTSGSGIGAGGGGAGGVGATGTGGGGAGGNGVANSITGSSVAYATGGAGKSNGGSACTASTANSGNGGMGGPGGDDNGCVGGSGVVIVSYPMQGASTTAIFNGSVGINNNSPTALIDSMGAGANNTTTSVSIKDSASRNLFRIDDSGNVGIGTDMSGQVGVFTVWGGNVGLGSTLPGQVLDIKGNARLAGANSLFLGTDAKAYVSASAATTPDITINTNSLERMRVTTGGNVGIGSITPGALIDVAGKTRITASGHLISTGTAPTVVSNDCGSTSQGALVAKSTDISGSVTVGTLAVTSCAVTFANAYTVAPNCVATDDSNILAIKASASTTKLTFVSTTSMSSDVLSWVCIGNE